MDLWRRPFTGAWIETLRPELGAAPAGVAPSRGRGLKLLAEADELRAERSPLHGGVD